MRNLFKSHAVAELTFKPWSPDCLVCGPNHPPFSRLTDQSSPAYSSLCIPKGTLTCHLNHREKEKPHATFSEKNTTAGLWLGGFSQIVILPHKSSESFPAGFLPSIGHPIPSFIQQIFIGHLLYVRHCSKHNRSENTDKNSCPHWITF